MFSSTGDWLAYESAAGDTAIVRKTAGGSAYTIHGRSAEFSMVALSPDGRWLASAGADYSLHIWEVATGKLAHGVPGQYTPSVLAFHPDGRRLAVNGGATDLASALQIWDIERRTLLPAPRIKHAISGLAFSKDGAYVAATSAGVEIFDAHRTSLVSRMDCATGSAFSPAFSPNNHLIAANCGGVITVWSIANGSEAFHFGAASDANNGPIAFSPDGRFLAAATASGVLVYDTVARRMGPTVTTTDFVTALAFNVSGEILAFGTRVRTPNPDQKQPILFVLDVRARRKVWSATAGEWVSELKFTRDGRALIAATGEDLHKSGTLTLFDAASGRAIRHLPVRVPSSVMPALSPNGEWFGFGWNSATSLWRLTY
jgi:WD40 repeat protein